MNILRFDAIAFDFDGVLVESVDVKTRAFAELYRPYGESIVNQVVDYHLAHGGISRYKKFRHFHRVFLNRELDSVEEKQLGDQFSALVEEAVIAAPMVAGAFDFLSRHQTGLPMFVVSGTPDDELQRIVDKRELRHFFKGTYGSPRSKADLLREIIDRGSFSPGRLLMVGDATTDYEGACGAGTAFIGRVAMGQPNPFPADVMVIPDLTYLLSLT